MRRPAVRAAVGYALAVLTLAGCTSGSRAGAGGSATTPVVSSQPSPAQPSTVQPSPAQPSSVQSSVESSSAQSSAGQASADWPAYHQNAQRTGVSATMPAATGTLTAKPVRLDGQVYASPLVVGGTVLVATERNLVYGLTLQGATKWSVSLGAPTNRADLPCGNIDPLGITGTPVYDAVSRSVFVVASIGARVRHDLVALDPATGAVRWRRDVDLPGTDAQAMQQRGALTIASGKVWVPFGGLAGDCGAYKGRLIGVPTGNGEPVAYTVPTTREAGIWTPPGPTEFAGKLLVAVGNGESVGGRYDFSDSVLALDGTRLVDSFSPTTWASDNAADLDLGSQGPAVVQGRWVFIAGKSGTGYVLRADRFGGIGGEVSQAEVCRSFGGTAVVADTVYVPCADGLRAVRIDSAGTARTLWRAAESVQGSPVVGGGRVYALDQAAGALKALDPATGRVREQVQVGDVSRFATPAIGGALLFVPTLSGITIVATGR